MPKVLAQPGRQGDVAEIIRNLSLVGFGNEGNVSMLLLPG